MGHREIYLVLIRLRHHIGWDAAVNSRRKLPMRRHTDAVLAAFTGFALTGLVMLPSVLLAHAEKAARIAAYEQALKPNITSI